MLNFFRIKTSQSISVCFDSAACAVFPRNQENNLSRRTYRCLLRSGVKLCLLVMMIRATVDVEAAGIKYKRQEKQRQFMWALPFAVSKPHSQTFLDQCMSLSDAWEHLRGGSSYQPDDWTNTNRNGLHDNEERDPYYQGNDRSANDYDDYGRVPSSGRKADGNGIAFVPKILQKGDRKTGLMLLVSGFSLTFLGITLFFNKTLMRLGNLLCIAGVLLTMGPTHTVKYFVQPEKLRATICLALGIFLVLVGSPLFGIVLEVFGILNLFGNMFPILMVFIKQMPMIGELFKSTTSQGNKSRNNRREEYYDDYGSSRDYNNDSRRASLQPPKSQYDNDRYDDYREDEDSSRQYY
jgi:Got1/Sft2-like family